MEIFELQPGLGEQLDTRAHFLWTKRELKTQYFLSGDIPKRVGFQCVSFLFIFLLCWFPSTYHRYLQIHGQESYFLLFLHTMVFLFLSIQFMKKSFHDF